MKLVQTTEEIPYDYAWHELAIGSTFVAITFIEDNNLLVTFGAPAVAGSMGGTELKRGNVLFKANESLFVKAIPGDAGTESNITTIDVVRD